MIYSYSPHSQILGSDMNIKDAIMGPVTQGLQMILQRKTKEV